MILEHFTISIMRTDLRYIAFLFMLAVSPVFSLSQAQEPGRYKNALTPADSQAIAAASAKADTGRMVPGLRNPDSYQSPKECLIAAEILNKTIWRTGERDTMQYGDSDSLPSALRELAHTCLTNMRSYPVDEMDVHHLLELNAVAGDTTGMRRVIDAYSNLTNIEEYRKIAFLNDASLMANRHRVSGRIEFAKSILEELKSYGDQSIAQTARIWGGLQNGARVRFDTTELLEMWDEQLKYFSQFTEEQMKASTPDNRSPFEPVVMMNKDLRTLAVLKRAPNLQDTVHAYGNAITKRFLHWTKSIEYENHIITSRLGRDPSDMELVLGFPEGTTPVPEAGKVTLYYRFLAKSLSPRASAALMNLKRLHDKYHKDGLEIVIVTELKGFLAGSPPLEPEQEARLHAWLIRDYLGLPFGVLVNRQGISKLADGRIVRHPTLFDRFFEEEGKPGAGNAGYIVGRDGKIQTVNLVAVGSLAKTSAFIEAEINRKSR